jgi:hypothetical protein
MRPLFLLPALALLASAQPPTPAGHAALRQACAADIARFCPDAQSGGGKVGQCMKGHRAELSGGCRDAIMKAHAAKLAATPH